MVDATFHQLYDQPRYEKLLQRAAAFQARFRPAVCQFANRFRPLFCQFANRKQGRFRQFANLMMRRDAGLLASPSDKERATRNGRPTASPWRMLAPSPRCAPVSASVRAIGKAGLSGRISAFGRAPSLVVAKVTHGLPFAALLVYTAQKYQYVNSWKS